MPRRRALVGLVVAAVVMAGVLAVDAGGAQATEPTSVAGDKGQGLEVYVNGTLTLRGSSQLGTPDVVAEQVAVCSAPGAQPVPTTVTGWSIARVIASAAATPSLVSTVTVTLSPPMRQPETVSFSSADFASPSDFYLGATAAIKAVDPPEPDFALVRPTRQAPCLDANPTLNGSVVEPLVVDITQLTRLLLVHAVAGLPKVSVGQPVQLQSAVSEPTAGVTYTTTWSFDDGATDATGADVSHTFSRVGTFTATAAVVGSDGSGGVSSPVTITVGKAPGTPGVGATATTQPPHGVAATGPASGVVVLGATAQSGVGAVTSGASTGASTGASPSPGTSGHAATATPRGGPAVVSGLLLAGSGVPGVHAQLLATGPHGTGISPFHLTTGESVGGLTAALLLVGGAAELRLGGDGVAAVRRTRRSRTAKGRHSP